MNIKVSLPSPSFSVLQQEKLGGEGIRRSEKEERDD